MPSNGLPGEPLAAIPGSVPSPLAFPSGCRFHERCAYAIPECAVTHPDLTPRGASDHAARCPVWAKLDENQLAAVVHPDTPSTHVRQVEGKAASVSAAPPILETHALHKRFKTVHAVDAVSIALHAGETLAVVGESGCGKTTLARMLIGLEQTSGGEILFDGKSIPKRRPFAMMRDMQMIFQDPFSSLNPRMTIADIITEGAVAHGIIKRRERIEEAQRLLAQVGMPPEAAFRYPHEFSGGQRQRISIARRLRTGAGA
jgi:peptide/nickel transport system ATP-binding protein